MSLRSLTFCAALVLAGAGSAAAQTVKIEFLGGRVNLVAQNAPARLVLSEWARLGGTQIVNGNNVAGAPLTLELTGKTEREALDIILRNVAGYIVSARPSPGVGGASNLDRVTIMATSNAPRPATATFGTPAQRPPTFEPDDAGPDITTLQQLQQRAAEQRAAEQNQAAGRVTGQPVIVNGDPTGAVVIRQGGVVQPPQPFFPAPEQAPPPAPPARGRAAQPASPFAPTPAPAQDARPANPNPDR